MKFVEAFKALGHQLANQRQDWSSSNETGVCLTLWTKETDWKALVYDTRLHAGDNAIWGIKSGNRKRIQHLQKALSAFDGWIDAVKIDGTPGFGYGTASPWIPSERKGLRWRVTFLEEATGHFRLEAQVPPNV